MLNTVTHGQPNSNTPLLIAHGLFGSARNWGVIAKRLSDDRQVIAADMRNHGKSDWFPTHSYGDLADDLGEVIRSLNVPVDVLGHSMGGKAAMVLALTQPELVRRLVVADIAPVSYPGVDLAPIAAMRSVDLSRVERRADAAEQMHSIPDELKPFLLQSLDLGNKRWRLNLDTLEREMERIRGFPEIRGDFQGPTLFLAGADSNYVQAAHRPSILSLFPNAEIEYIPHAGHWLHAEKPREFEAAVRAFLDR